MASIYWDRNLLLRRALLASLGVHALVAFFLPIWSVPQPGTPQWTDTLTFGKIAHIRLEKPLSAQALPVAVPDTTNRARRVTFARSKAELTAKSRSPRVRPTAQNGPRGTTAAAPRHVALPGPAPLYAQVASSSVPVAALSHPPTDQTPQAEARAANRSVAGTGTHDRGGVLPFGAGQEPVLDPGVKSELQRRFNVHVTLTVVVDEDGRTKHITFDPPIDPQTESAIASLLAQANWDAAVCGGGVSCEGTATIKL